MAQNLLRPKIDLEELLAHLKACINEAPTFEYKEHITEENVAWLGKAEALFELANDTTGGFQFSIASKSLNTYNHSRVALLRPLYKLYSSLELRAPSSVHNAFIPPGDSWKGYGAIVKLFKQSKRDLLVIDPYLDATIYLECAPHLPEDVNMRCLTLKNTKRHEALVAAAQKWSTTRSSDSVETRYTAKSNLHDRIIVVDGEVAYQVSQSLKDIGKNAGASITRFDPELAQLKRELYEGIWQIASPICPK